MAKTKKDNQNMEFPLQIVRQYPAPLDKYSLFYSLSDAEDYAKNSPLAYVGQLLSVVNEADKTVDIYKINADGTLGGLVDAKHIDNTFVKKSGDTMTGTLQVNAPIIGYNYINNHSAPAFILDKVGSYASGIGASGEADIIKFGAVKAFNEPEWQDDYKQKWSFNGEIIADGGIYDKGQRVYSPNNPQPLYQHDVHISFNSGNSKILITFLVNYSTQLSTLSSVISVLSEIGITNSGSTLYPASGIYYESSNNKYAVYGANLDANKTKIYIEAVGTMGQITNSSPQLNIIDLVFRIR